MSNENTDTDTEEEQVERGPGASLMQDAQQQLQQAQQLDAQVTQIKQWSIQTATELRTRAQVLNEEGRIDDDTVEQIENIAEQIQSLYGSIN